MAWRFYEYQLVRCPQEQVASVKDFLRRTMIEGSLSSWTLLERIEEEFGHIPGIEVSFTGDFNTSWSSDDPKDEDEDED